MFGNDCIAATRAIGRRWRRGTEIMGRMEPEVVYSELFNTPVFVVSLATLAMFVTVASIMGPLRTDTTLQPLQRVLYWGLCGGTLWPLCYLSGAATLQVLRFFRSFELGLALATVAASLYVALLGVAVLRATDTLFRPDTPEPMLGEIFPVIAIIVAVGNSFVCLVVYQRILHRLVLVPGAVDRGWTRPLVVLAPRVAPTNGAGTTGFAGKQDSSTAEKALAKVLDRLPARLGRNLIYLRVIDHYLEVHTVDGHDLILMRMGDAVAGLGELGLQVHRSFWVSLRHVKDLVTVRGRHRLRLTGGREVPVSRTYLPAARAAVRSMKPAPRDMLVPHGQTKSHRWSR